MESFSPQGRSAPLPFSVRLREGALPRPRRGTMAALRLHLRLGAPFTTMSLPLTSVLYVPNFPFNLISISKLTRDLHCVLTFSHNSVTL